MGGGRDKFLTNKGTPHGTGHRLSGDLIEAWKQDKSDKKAQHVYLSDAAQLEALKENPNKTDYILGTSFL